MGGLLRTAAAISSIGRWVQRLRCGLGGGNHPLKFRYGKFTIRLRWFRQFTGKIEGVTTTFFYRRRGIPKKPIVAEREVRNYGGGFGVAVGISCRSGGAGVSVGGAVSVAVGSATSRATGAPQAIVITTITITASRILTALLSCPTQSRVSFCM